MEIQIPVTTKISGIIVNVIRANFHCTATAMMNAATKVERYCTTDVTLSAIP